MDWLISWVRQQSGEGKNVRLVGRSIGSAVNCQLPPIHVICAPCDDAGTLFDVVVQMPEGPFLGGGVGNDWHLQPAASPPRRVTVSG